MVIFLNIYLFENRSCLIIFIVYTRKIQIDTVFEDNLDKPFATR